MSPAPDFPPYTCPGYEGLWYRCPVVTAPPDHTAMIGAAVLLIVCCAVVGIAMLVWLLWGD